MSSRATNGGARRGGFSRTPPNRPSHKKTNGNFASKANLERNSLKSDTEKHATIGHTVDDDYMATLEAQLSKEKATGVDAVTQAMTAKKKKKFAQLRDQDGDDNDEQDETEDLSPDAIKKAMAAALKDGGDDEDHKSSRSSSTKSAAKSHSNSKIKREDGETEEAYKQRLKAELRKRKNEKKKVQRAAVVSEKMALAHAAALERKAERQRAHQERQAAERAAKAERLAKEKEAGDGLTNKQRRLMREKKDAEDAAAAAATKANGNGAAKSDSNKKKEESSTTKPQSTASSTATSTKPTTQPSKSKSTPSTSPSTAPVTTVSKTSKPSLPPADLTTPLPKHHDWEEFNLHPSILRALLLDLKFTQPTPIQQQVLTPAIRDWKDISAAATTGSGKTLAFGIPIVQRLLTLQEQPDWVDPKKVQALILTPTRELALQIVSHLEALTRYITPAIGVAPIVGGISEEKQKRILDKKHPAIVVATPGRLWELIEEGELQHLNSAYYLRFLVLDEADRMVDVGHFAELEKILTFIETHSTYESILAGKSYKKAIQVFDGFEMLEDGDELEVEKAKAKKMAAAKKAKQEKKGKTSANEDDGEEDEAEDVEMLEEDDEGEDVEEDEEDEDVSEAARLAAAEFGLKKSKSSKHDDIDWNSFLTEEEIFAKEGRKAPKESTSVEDVGEPSDDEEDEDDENEDQDGEEEDEDDEMVEDDDAEDDEQEDIEDADDADMPDAESDGGDDSPQAPSANSKTLRRQIFLFSATLMLPSSGREDASKVKAKSQSRRKNFEPETVLQKLADKITFQKNTTPCIVDLSTTHQVASTLQEVRADCLTEDKDYLAYYFLVMYPGKTLVFVNSISCLRRLLNLLTQLKLPVYGLHAEMQQKARLKSLERFKSQENAILICTDVAARGLDIPQVPYIMHYQLPRTADVYIHRSGRVARAGAEGLSCALIDEHDTKIYRRLCLVLKKVDGIPALPIDQGFMTQIRARMHVARELDTILHTDRKEHSKRDWFLRQAEAMEMEIDEEELQIDRPDENDDEGSRQTEKDRLKKEKLKRELDFLLSKPLMHGTLNRKFYTLNAARGFDLNKESAGIAQAGTQALSDKNGGVVRAGGAQNIAVGTTKNTKAKLPSMLQKAREEIVPPPPTTATTETTKPTTKSTNEKTVVSLSAKRKQPEPTPPVANAKSAKKKKSDDETTIATAAAAAATTTETAELTQPTAKKQKLTNKKK